MKMRAVTAIPRRNAIPTTTSSWLGLRRPHSLVLRGRIQAGNSTSSYSSYFPRGLSCDPATTITATATSSIRLASSSSGGHRPPGVGDKQQPRQHPENRRRNPQQPRNAAQNRSNHRTPAGATPPPPPSGTGTHSSGTNRDDSQQQQQQHPGQDFVERTIEPQRWDEYTYENPLYEPEFKQRTKLLSKEDFRNRPRVGFSVYFNSPVDAMILPTWMTGSQQAKIFQMYRDLLKGQYDKFGITSHEYIMRVIAQQKNLRAERVAAVVQLQYNEALFRLEGKEVSEESGKYMDNSFVTELRLFYKAYNMQPPGDLNDNFVEDPDPGNLNPTSDFREVDDVFDFDEIWRNYQDEYLPKQAKEIVAKHKYVEDIDEDTIIAPFDKDKEHYLKRYEQLSEIINNATGGTGKDKEPNEAEEEASLPAPAVRKGQRNKKKRIFVAQLVNTREQNEKMRQARRKPVTTMKAARERQLMSKAYTNNSPRNSLVEDNGTLRKATLADLRNVAWGPMRHELGKRFSMEESVAVQEYIYRTAKLDWLNYINKREHTGVFGTDGKIAPTSVALVQSQQIHANHAATATATTAANDSTE